MSSAPMATHAAPGLDCFRDAGSSSSMKLCHKGPSVESDSAGQSLPCTSDDCTHCAVTSYYGHAQRVASCAEMVRSAATRLGRQYKYFAYHRPDLLLYGIPPYAEWRFDAKPKGGSGGGGGEHGLARRAFFCAPLPHAPPSDFFGIFSYEHIDLVAGMARFTMGCQPRARNVRAHSRWCNDRGWPAWHTSECLLHAAYARAGVRIESLTDDYWPQMRRPCRILRDRSKELGAGASPPGHASENASTSTRDTTPHSARRKASSSSSAVTKIK